MHLLIHAARRVEQQASATLRPLLKFFNGLGLEDLNYAVHFKAHFYMFLNTFKDELLVLFRAGLSDFKAFKTLHTS